MAETWSDKHKKNKMIIFTYFFKSVKKKTCFAKNILKGLTLEHKVPS